MVYFVRHADKETGAGYDDNYNEALGIMDDPLSEKGKEQAKKIAERFRDVDIKKIFVSQYIRAHQTAAPAAQQKKIGVTEDSRVNEINNGALRNMSGGEIAAAYPKLWSDFSSHSCDVQLPGGESGEQVKARQDSFLNDIKSERSDILVVSHDGYIRLLMCNILGLPVYKRYKFKTDMGGISAIYYDPKDGEWKIAAFNHFK